MDKIKRFFRVVPKKHHVEFITALLSIPVLLTVIALNWSSLNGSKKEAETKPSEIIISLPVQKDPTPLPTKVDCKPGVGSVDITAPSEGDTLSTNPVNVIVTYKPGDYCAAVWSYRTNGGTWSDYDDKSIALYNLPSGDIQLELRIKSIVNGEEKKVTRNFIYTANNPTATIPPSPTTQAPTVSPTVTPVM